MITMPTSAKHALLPDTAMRRVAPGASRAAMLYEWAAVSIATAL
jgi:hypothetical protein